MDNAAISEAVLMAGLLDPYLWQLAQGLQERPQGLLALQQDRGIGDMSQYLAQLLLRAPPIVPQWGQLEPGNIDLNSRPVVHNPDGTISTVRSMSFTDAPGRDVLLPTVRDNGWLMSDQQAIDDYRRSGRHLGIFDSPEAATYYAIGLHNDQAKKYRGK